jgi:hypothetical protein
MFVKIKGDLISLGCTEAVVRREDIGITINTRNKSYNYDFADIQERETIFGQLVEVIRSNYDVQEIGPNWRGK